MKKTIRELMIIGAMVAIPAAVGYVSFMVTPGDVEAKARDQVKLEELMQLADAGTAKSSATSGPQGAPLGATGAAPQGAPLGASGATPQQQTPQGDPIRVIPQSSLDLVTQVEGTNADPLAFEKTQDGRFTKVTFAGLGSYKYEIPDPDEVRAQPNPQKPPVDQIPAAIRALDGEQALLVGFMVPIEITREGKVKSFALTQNQAFCCYGTPPGMNEWVMVNMDEGVTSEYIMDIPVAAYGQLGVGEEIDDGYVLSIYRMKSSEVITAHELLKRAKPAGK